MYKLNNIITINSFNPTNKYKELTQILNWFNIQTEKFSLNLLFIVYFINIYISVIEKIRYYKLILNILYY